MPLLKIQAGEKERKGNWAFFGENAIATARNMRGWEGDAAHVPHRGLP